ncbi:MAG: phosphopantetheine-binding protein [Polaromonas sp.]|nr:phosphopantetheine-binding protein [Polaromonas sp.]
MPSTATLDRLSAILMNDYKLEAGQLTPDAPLEALGIDSLGVADLLFNIEDEFGISLPPEPVQLLTLGDVVRFIDELVASQQAQAAAPGVAPPAALPQATSFPVP